MMTESPTSSQPVSDGSKGSLLDQFRGLWKENAVWRDRLARRASYAALDIPDDDMQIKGGDQITLNAGLGAKGLVGLAAAIGIPWVGAAALAYSIYTKPDAPSEISLPQSSEHSVDADTRYTITPLPGGSE